MFLEVAAGYMTGSMALLADGLHMATHAFAFLLAIAAYYFMRKYANSKMFKSGTDKIGDLSGFASSMLLAFTGIWIIGESVGRLLNPIEISFNNAIIVAFFGLAVNVACLFVMGGAHIHVHAGRLESHGHEHSSTDNNFAAAYFHILADILTSVLAILALFSAKYWGWNFADAIVGVLGGLVVIKWSVGIMKSSGASLLDIVK